MLRRFVLLCGGFVAAALIVGSLGATNVKAGNQAAVTEPVPSLTPVATEQLWSELVQRPRSQAVQAADCQPLRAVFYAATDWLRLTTRLAASASPCAQYYISVPPLAADKTQLRSDQAWRIRALGPAFHALAEINVTGWTAWVASTGGTWYEAGVEARRRMATAGYDVSAGDAWALNELSSAVRQGVGNARANMRAFLEGLYDGDGVLPVVQGTVFVAGIGQGTTDLSLYQARLQDWYEDAGFWSDLSQYASDWSQELYGDVRHYAVAGTSRDTRRDSLNEYLQHQVSLASVAPAAAAAARDFLSATYSPLANAAWQYDASFGWTNVPVELMQDYVSAQTYATRSAANSRFGFAWSPRNLAELPAGDFNAQTDALLVRLAAAIADSAQSPEAACGATWCTASLDGAAATTAWRTFSTWKPSALAFTTSPQTVSAGSPSAPMTVELRTSSGTSYTAGIAVPVELSSSSPTAQLSTTSSGPWTATLATSIASGQSTTSFYYRDTQSGAATVAAVSVGKTAATQAITVGAPPAETPPAETPPATPSAAGVATADSRRAGRRHTDGRHACRATGHRPARTPSPNAPCRRLDADQGDPARADRRRVDPLLARCTCAAPRPRDAASLHPRDRTPSRNHVRGAPSDDGPRHGDGNGPARRHVRAPGTTACGAIDPRAVLPRPNHSGRHGRPAASADDPHSSLIAVLAGGNGVAPAREL